jgi:hypothetical protein
LGRIGYIVNGPLQLSETNGAPAIGRGLQELARQERLFLLVVTPPLRGDRMAEELASYGFTPHLDQFPPSGLPSGLLYVDVSRPVSDIMKSVRRTTRQEIAKGLRSGLSVREGGWEELPLFWDHLDALCRRRGVAANVSGLPYVRKAWCELSPSRRCRLFVAETGGKPIASLLCILSRPWFHAWRIGWSGEAPHAHPPKVLFAHAMQVAATEGYRWFDFGGIDVRVAERAAAGLDCGPMRDAGITIYKMAFGGITTAIPQTLDYFTSPVLRAMLAHGGGRLLKLTAVNRILHHLLSHHR